jgi:hypothetical protein
MENTQYKIVDWASNRIFPNKKIFTTYEYIPLIENDIPNVRKGFSHNKKDLPQISPPN